MLASATSLIESSCAPFLVSLLDFKRIGCDLQISEICYAPLNSLKDNTVCALRDPFS